MSSTFAIDRVLSRYRVRGEIAEPERIARRLDGALERHLGDAFEREAAAALAAAGLGPEAPVAVRTLELRLRVHGAEIDGELYAQAFAGALRAALDALLARRPRGGADEQVALFPDRGAAIETWLLALARGEREAWWWRPLLAERGLLPRPASVLARWIEERPHELPARLARVLRAAPAGWSALFDEAEAAALLRAWRARVARRSDELAGARSAGLGARRGGAALLPELARELRELLAAPVIGLERRRLAAAMLGAALHPTVAPRALETLDELCGHARARAAPSPADGRGAAERGIAVDAAAATEGEGIEDGAVHARPARASGSGRAAQREGGEEELGALLDPSLRAPVWLGGLLLLVRPLCAGARFATWPGVELEERLLALWLEASRALLDGLPVERRAELLARERPLLCVLCGTDALPRELHAWTPADAVRDEAVETLRELLERIPAGVMPCGRAWQRWRGDSGTPDELAPAWRALAALAPRPGRLEWSSTHADLHWPSEAADLALRRAGWDQDPGWIPWLGRVLRFHFGRP